MGDCLAPCPSCARHVRSAERTCPFCGQAIAERVWPRAPAVSPKGPLTRAALVFAGAAAVAGCHDAPVPAYSPAPDFDAAQYDAPSEAAPEAGPTDGGPGDGGPADGGQD